MRRSRGLGDVYKRQAMNHRKISKPLNTQKTLDFLDMCLM
jgi:hypothetical protein